MLAAPSATARDPGLERVKAAVSASGKAEPSAVLRESELAHPWALELASLKVLELVLVLAWA